MITANEASNLSIDKLAVGRMLIIAENTIRVKAKGGEVGCEIRYHKGMYSESCVRGLEAELRSLGFRLVPRLMSTDDSNHVLKIYW